MRSSRDERRRRRRGEGAGRQGGRVRRGGEGSDLQTVLEHSSDPEGLGVVTKACPQRRRLHQPHEVQHSRPHDAGRELEVRAAGLLVGTAVMVVVVVVVMVNSVPCDLTYLLPVLHDSLPRLLQDAQQEPPAPLWHEFAGSS